MSSLKESLMHLVSQFKPINYPTSLAPKARNEERSKRQKTKKDAAHIPGKKFVVRQIIQIKLNNGETISPTPALYRRLHLGNRKKASTNGS